MTWRAFRGVLDTNAWGIETDDTEAVSKGEEQIAPPVLAEHIAKDIVAAHNSSSASQRAGE